MTIRHDYLRRVCRLLLLGSVILPDKECEFAPLVPVLPITCY